MASYTVYLFCTVLIVIVIVFIFYDVCHPKSLVEVGGYRNQRNKIKSKVTVNNGLKTQLLWFRHIKLKLIKTCFGFICKNKEEITVLTSLKWIQKLGGGSVMLIAGGTCYSSIIWMK